MLGLLSADFLLSPARTLSARRPSLPSLLRTGMLVNGLSQHVRLCTDGALSGTFVVPKLLFFNTRPTLP